MPSLYKVFSQGALQQAAGHGVCWLCRGCQELVPLTLAVYSHSALLDELGRLRLNL